MDFYPSESIRRDLNKRPVVTLEQQKSHIQAWGYSDVSKSDRSNYTPFYDKGEYSVGEKFSIINTLNGFIR